MNDNADKIAELEARIDYLSDMLNRKKDRESFLWEHPPYRNIKPVKLVFKDMLGDVADCVIKQNEDKGGYRLYLNGTEIPCVMHHHLEYGYDFQKVVIEVAVRSYESNYHEMGVEFPATIN